MQSKILESLSTTEKPLAESKSTSNQFYGLTNQAKGLWAEETAKKYFLKNKYNLLHQRKKLKFGEIDLIFKKENSMYFVEVKYLHNPWMSFQRLNQKQKARLIKNLIHYQHLNRKYRVYCLLCFVDRLGQVAVIDLNS